MKSSNIIPKNIVALLFAAVLGLPSIAVAQLTTDSLLITGAPAVLSQPQGTETLNASYAGGTTKSIQTLTTLGAPYVSATAISDDSYSDPGVTAQVNLTYYFEIVERRDNQVINQILLNIMADSVANSTDNTLVATDVTAIGSSDFSVSGTSIGFQTDTNGGPDSFTVNQNVFVNSGTLYQVRLDVVSRAGGVNTATAYIDPTFTVDPSYANDYSILFSPNLVVPEPSTYALMLGGLAFLVFCARRKAALVK